MLNKRDSAQVRSMLVLWVGLPDVHVSARSERELVGSHMLYKQEIRMCCFYCPAHMEVHLFPYMQAAL